MNKIEDIALFDMDGTLCDYDVAMFKELEKIRGPEEQQYRPLEDGTAPEHIKRRMELISSREEFWVDMPRLKLGWDILEIAKELGFRNMILTQAPKKEHLALSGKKKWLDKNLPGIDFTMTRDKGLVYGKVFVDDFIPYIERWLTWRKNGLVIMPAGKHNERYLHEQVIRYEGSNTKEVYEAMEKAKKR